MPVIRGPSPLKDYYQVPNRLARDDRLSFEARGLLVYLLTHKEGWKVQPKQLAENGGCGVQRVYRLLRELAEHGYATCETSREVGKFASHDWTVTDVQPPLDCLPHVEKPHVVNHPLRRTIKKEEQFSKKIDRFPFDDFWSTYPNKQGKQTAKQKWSKLPDDLREAAMQDVAARIAGDPQWKDGYVPHGSTYLNQRRWEDEWRTAPKRAERSANQRFANDFQHPKYPPRVGEEVPDYHARLRGILSREGA